LTEANAELEARVAERTREPAAAAAEMTATLGGHEQFKAALVQLQKYEALGRITAGVVNAVDSKLGVINSSYRAIGLASADATVLGGVATGSAAASHIAMLVRHLTAFARPHPFAGTFFDAKEALTDITVLCRHVIGEAYTLSLEIADDLFAVSVDRDMLQAAFIILVTSAQEAMPQGGPIAVAAHNVPNDAAPDGVAGKPGDVAISVRDLGRGMPVHPFERATWPFFASNSFSGSDLGFAMIDVFASLNGGRLQVENAQGLGTTVTLFLPASTTEPTA
jgi:two-component system NtrC family sensor kinase